MIPKTEQELIGEIRMLNANIDVDEQELTKKKDLRDKYLRQLSDNLGKIPWQIMELRKDGKA